LEKIFDTIIKNARLVRPNRAAIDMLDIGIKDGRVSRLNPNIRAELGREIVDAEGLLAFPGVVDAHMHTGIYAPLDQDAQSESRAAASGGVTTSLNYMRTGQYYLNKGGAYRDFFPEVLGLSEGKFYVDYAYHLAPMSQEHIEEMPELVEKFGVNSFKIFMFYGGHGLHGHSQNQNEFLMLKPDERYDIAHFENVMRGIRASMDKFPSISSQLSLSMHCETAEIMRAYTKLVEKEGDLSGLRAYSASRPPHSEGLAIVIGSYLAHETGCYNINLLHLTSFKAVEAALKMADAFPHINFKREVTIAHLLLDVDCPHGNLAKVNPPIRPREDVEYLWQSLLDRKIDWVVSDHACCAKEIKTHQQTPDNIFLAKSGFGGTEYLLPALITEGSRRGMSYSHMSELLSWTPAKRFGLGSKGDLAEGYDADIALVNPDRGFVIGQDKSHSQQGYSPLDGFELTARVEQTFLRGQCIFKHGNIVGGPKGQFIKRPTRSIIEPIELG
jgi:allantoinase